MEREQPQPHESPQLAVGQAGGNVLTSALTALTFSTTASSSAPPESPACFLISFRCRSYLEQHHRYSARVLRVPLALQPPRGCAERQPSGGRWAGAEGEWCLGKCCTGRMSSEATSSPSAYSEKSTFLRNLNARPMRARARVCLHMRANLASRGLQLRADSSAAIMFV